MYLGKELIEDKLYQIIDQFNQIIRKILSIKFYSILFMMKMVERVRFYDIIRQNI